MAKIVAWYSAERRFALVEVDNKDYVSLSKYDWRVFLGGKTCYAVIGSGRHLIYMHRLIMSTPNGMECDHKDLNGLNNHRKNLRNCTRSQNKANQYLSYGSSEYKGVSWDLERSKWAAYIFKDSLKHHLGRYDSEEDAARAYNVAALEMFGEFARLNDV